MNEIKIDKNVPVPGHGRLFGVTETFRRMEIGDSIVMPLKFRRQHSTHAKYAKIKTKSRQISETEIRIWRIE